MRTFFRTESLERFILWAGAAALLVPALYSPWFLYPYIFGRTIFFQLTVEAMALAWILLIARRPQRYGPRWHPLGIALAAFVGIALVASLVGVDPGRSVWGTELRMTGWFTIFHAFLYFLILSSVVSGDRDWRKLFSVSSVVIGGMAALSFGERFSPAIRAAIFGGERVQSTTGNPIFFAAILLFGIAFAGWLAATSRGRGRIFWLLLLAIEAMALAFTETRGATVAFFLTLGAFLLAVQIFSRKKKVRLGALVFTAVLIGGLASAWFSRDTAFVKHYLPQIYRLGSTELSLGTSATRLITWSIALDGLRVRPVLGWGLENFNAVFDRFYRPKLLRHGFYETVSDKPHNGLLEVGVATGTIGLLAYLAIFGIAAVSLFRGFRSGCIDGATAVAFGGALLAYQIQNFFALDTPNSLVLLALTLAFIQNRLVPPRPATGHESSSGQFPRAAAATLLVVAAPLSYFGNFASLPGSWEAGQAQEVAGRDAVLWKDPARKAIRSGGPHRRELRLAMTRDFLNWEGGGRMPPNVVKEVVDAFISEMAKSVSSRSATFQERFMLAQLFMIKGEYFNDSGAYADAENQLRLARELSPERQAVPFLLGRLYIMTDRPADAIRVLEEELAKDPSVAEARWFHGLGLIATGKRAEGISELEEAGRLGRGLQKASEIHYLIALYAEDENYERIVPLYQRLIELDPQNPDWHARLAATYAKLGKNLEAIMEAQRAAELDPTYAEAALKFVDSLDENRE